MNDLIKCFKVWLIRVDEWFRHPSPLSLLISLLAPGLVWFMVFSVWTCEPEYASRFLQMSAGSHLVPYETWCTILLGSMFSFGWCMFHWFADLSTYIISLFHKSSAPADDK